MDFVKHFCRLITQEELSNEDVTEYFDIVQSVVPVKLVVAHSEDGEHVSAEVIIYEGTNDRFIYEIVLQEQISLDEGEDISDELAASFPDIDFDFETSLEI
jgi:hypothetical protein